MAQLEAVPFVPETPAFTVLIVIGTVVPGTTAMLMALLAKGPAIPGPLKKNPNASFTVPHTYSGYSSDAKTNRNEIESPFGTKSNSRIETSAIVTPDNVARSASLPVPVLDDSKLVDAPPALPAFPVARMTPFVIPRLVPIAVNEPRSMLDAAGVADPL